MITPKPNPITVKQLIEHLKQFNGDLVVIYQCCSDYSELYLEDINTVKALNDKDGKPKRYYSYHFKTQEEKEWAESRITEYLEFPGN